MQKKYFAFLAILIPLLCLCAVVTYFLPPVHDRLAWRLDDAMLRVGYALNPPEKQVFVPQQSTLQADLPQPVVTVIGGAGPTAPAPTPTFTTAASLTPAMPGDPTAAPAAIAAAEATSTAAPLPSNFYIKGIQYEDQHGRWNYCAPSTLAMALTYWGWQGNRDTVGPVLKPVEKDKNVMPYEMEDYVNTQAALGVALRIGGNMELVKRFVVAGYPVLVEKGVFLTDISGVYSWMGHYEIVNGYDDAKGVFITQDAYTGPDYKVSYDDFITGWRAFNYTYLIIYPKPQEAEIMALLGSDADEQTNAQNALQKASNEILSTGGMDLYFSWFNRGSSLVKLQDYAGAAQAYDAAFKVYPTIPEDKRPWRMLWYQTGPYFAYYYTQRYTDLLNLADGTLKAMQGDKNLEESYYWRGMAEAALGDTQAAINDMSLALKYHPGFGPALVQLQQLAAKAP